MQIVKTVVLELPVKALSPNARPNRHQKTRLVKEARSAARRETYKAAQSWGYPAGTYFVTSLQLTAFWKSTRHKWDNINLLAACKSYEDGIQDALGQDDSSWEMEKPEHFFSPTEPRLEVQIRIELL